MLTLYGCYRSRATRPLWALFETDMAFTHIPVIQAYRLPDPAAADAPVNTATPSFLAVNPMGQIPAMVDGDLVLTESLAITLHIARLAGGAIAPTTNAETALMEQWALFATSSVEGPALDITLTLSKGQDKTPEGAWPEYSLISELFSTTFFTVETPKRKALSDMAAHWSTPATSEQKERLTQNGLYRRIGPDDVEVLSPTLERIGIQLAELNVPLDTVLDLQDQLIKHTRIIAQTYVEQVFLSLAKNVTHKAEGAKTTPIDARVMQSLTALFERLRPLAIGSISAAFPVVLQQEFDRSIQTELKRKP